MILNKKFYFGKLRIHGDLAGERKDTSELKDKLEKQTDYEELPMPLHILQPNNSLINNQLKLQ